MATNRVLNPFFGLAFGAAMLVLAAGCDRAEDMGRRVVRKSGDLVGRGAAALGLTGDKGRQRRAARTDEMAALGFSVEFRPAHPFLAEYYKCVVFPSGKHVGIWMDTGGAGPFAVWRLPTGEYYLVDGLEHDFVRNDYRVNAANETVEMMCGETWFAIPDGALAVTATSNMGFSVKTAEGEKSVDVPGVPVGDSLKGRVYLGLLLTSGRFELGEGDPYADVVEPKWTPVGLDGGDNVPFSLECRRWKGRRHYRLAFSSGKRIEFASDFCSADGGFSLYVLEDGRYHLTEARQVDVKWRKEWRIDTAGEAVEIMVKDHWDKFGDAWVPLSPGSTSSFVPVGDSLLNARFAGTFRPPEDAPQTKVRTRERKERE